MASPLTFWPPRSNCESQVSDDDAWPPQENQVASCKEKQPASSTVTVVRIPADGSLPHLTTLELVKATSKCQSDLRDSDLAPSSNGDGTHDHQCHPGKYLNPMIEDVQIDLNELHHSSPTVYERTGLHTMKAKRRRRRKINPYRDSSAPALEVPLAAISNKPYLSFTHASLRFQPNVVDRFWKCGEAWKYRAFKRLYAFPRENTGLDTLTGEYHIMYTFAAATGLPFNQWGDLDLFGDAFVLRMASEKDDDGDWYYEDISQDILYSSLGNQCLETLKSVRPFAFETMVGERGNGPPGYISPGRGISGIVAYA